MLKKIRDCSYKEVRDYYNHKCMDPEVGILLGALGYQYVRDEISWNMRMHNEFPRVFKKSLLDKEIDV